MNKEMVDIGTTETLLEGYKEVQDLQMYHKIELLLFFGCTSLLCIELAGLILSITSELLGITENCTILIICPLAPSMNKTFNTKVENSSFTWN